MQRYSYLCICSMTFFILFKVNKLKPVETNI